MQKEHLLSQLNAIFMDILGLIKLIRPPLSVGIRNSCKQVVCAKAKASVARHIWAVDRVRQAFQRSSMKLVQRASRDMERLRSMVGMFFINI